MTTIEELHCVRKRDQHTQTLQEELMQQLGLLRIRTVNLSLRLPAPYSEQAFEKAHAMRQESGGNIFEAGRAGDQFGRPEIEKQECRYRAAMFYWEKFPTDSLVKGLIYFSVAPEVAGVSYMRQRFGTR